MADEKRKGGFDPDRMRGQLNEMWKNAMDGLEDLREVVLKASQNAKVRLDATFLRRERDRLYQQLGEETYALAETGKLKVPAELRDTVDRIHAIVEQVAAADREAEAAEEAGEGGEAEGGAKAAIRRQRRFGAGPGRPQEGRQGQEEGPLHQEEDGLQEEGHRRRRRRLTSGPQGHYIARPPWGSPGKRKGNMGM